MKHNRDPESKPKLKAKYPGPCFDLHFDRFDEFIFEAEKPFENVCVNDSNCFCFRFALCTPHFCVRLLTSSGWSETCSRRVGPHKVLLATQDFFRLDHRQSFWPKHRPKLLPEPTQRSRALTSHCTLLRNLLRTVTRLQVTAHCCVKLLRTITRLQVTAQTAA